MPPTTPSPTASHVEVEYTAYSKRFHVTLWKGVLVAVLGVGAFHMLRLLSTGLGAEPRVEITLNSVPAAHVVAGFSILAALGIALQVAVRTPSSADAMALARRRYLCLVLVPVMTAVVSVVFAPRLDFGLRVLAVVLALVLALLVYVLSVRVYISVAVRDWAELVVTLLFVPLASMLGWGGLLATMGGVSRDGGDPGIVARAAVCLVVYVAVAAALAAWSLSARPGNRYRYSRSSSLALSASGARGSRRTPRPRRCGRS